MTDQTKTTGTLDQDGGDALEPSAKTGTPDPEQSRDAESKETDWKAVALANKQRIADLEAKVKDYEEADPSPPVTDSPEVRDKTDQIDKVEAQVEEFRRRGDPVAAFAMEERAARLKLERDLILTRQLDRVPSDMQDKVLKHFNKNRHRLGDINAALNEVRNPDLEAENKALKDRLAALEKPPDPDVEKAPPTHGREITARETKSKQMTGAQYASEYEKLKRTQGDAAARAFAARLNKREIQITD